MRSNTQTKKSLMGALALAAAALLMPGYAPAQTAKPQPAPVDETAATSTGANSGPTHISADSAGNLWVTLQFSNKVAKLDSGGNLIGTYATGSNPTGVAAGDGVWVANNGDNTVTKLSLSGAVLGTYKSGGEGPQAVLLLGDHLWVANERSNTVTRVSGKGVVVSTIPVGDRPTALAADAAGNVWVANNKSNTVTKISPAATVLGTYKVGSGPFGLAAVGLDVFVSCFFDGTVQRVSGATGQVLSQIAVGDGAAGLTHYGQYYLVAVSGTNSVTVFSEAGTVHTSLRVGRGPLGVAATPTGYWIANSGSDSVSRR